MENSYGGGIGGILDVGIEEPTSNIIKAPDDNDIKQIIDSRITQESSEGVGVEKNIEESTEPVLDENIQVPEDITEPIIDNESGKQGDFDPSPEQVELPLIVMKQPELSDEQKLDQIRFLQDKIKELKAKEKQPNFNQVYQLEQSIEDLGGLKQSITKGIEKVEEEPKGFFKRFSNKTMELFQFKSKKEQTTFFIFMLPPIVISLISAWHVQMLFALVNPWFLSWLLAGAFELAALASLFSLKMLGKINNKLIWALIGIIVIMQALGNTFAAFAVLSSSNELVMKLIELLALGEIFGANLLPAFRILAFLLGGTLPIISFIFMKSITEYLDSKDGDTFESILETKE